MASKGQLNDMFKQLEECMKKCDSLSHDIKTIKSEHKKEINQLKADFSQERNSLNLEIKKLNNIIVEKDENIKKLNNEVDRLKK